MKTPRFWQQKNALSTALVPLSFLYGIGAVLDRALATPKHAKLPVISVGNVTAGGAGKTPATLAIIPLLRDLGHTPHILIRGYKGAALSAHRVQENDDWKTVGDEALLLAKAAPTWVGADRFAAAHAAAKSGATILVCDDALQHHALHKDVSLLVIDGAYGNGNGWLLPAGPLREPFSAALARVDAVVVIGEDVQNLTHNLSIPVFRATLQPAQDAAFIANKKWFAFAGIARPEKFYASLRALGANLVATRDFSDHHAYSEAGVKRLFAQAEKYGARLITTAKDAVKIPAAYRSNIQVLDVALVLEEPQKLSNFLTTKHISKTLS